MSRDLQNNHYSIVKFPQNSGNVRFNFSEFSLFFQFIFQPTPSARTLPFRTHAVTQQVFAPMTNDLTENAIRTVPKNTLTSQERKMYENTSESVAATTAATSSALFPHLAEAQITSAQI